MRAWHRPAADSRAKERGSDKALAWNGVVGRELCLGWEHRVSGDLAQQENHISPVA